MPPPRHVGAILKDAAGEQRECEWGPLEGLCVNAEDSGGTQDKPYKAYE
ncbi:hypothetical protein PRBEI_2001507700 [Prionailurus iriomotensis]